MSASASSSRASVDNGRSEPLYQVKLLSALRSGDPALIHPFLAEIGKDKRKSIDGGDFDTGAAALHLAVRCASPDTVAILLSHRAISPNGVYPPGSGTTPLHLAASLGRTEIVNLLLDQENINDTLLDNQQRSCKDVAKGRDVLHAIEDSRAFLNASYRSLLRSYILSQPGSEPSMLIKLLESPRVRFVNLSYLDDDSGTSLLHEAAKRKDLRLIELAVRAGADVFVRNRRGKMAYEGTGKDDRARVFLRQFANQDTTLIPSSTPSLEPPELRGYLNKYTNVAKGYNTRWFVLKNGVLSYYRHQEDETVASRGSISMKTAILRTSATDKLRFEVHSTPSRSHSSSGVQKWYMKTNHPVEAGRWIQAARASIEWYKRGDAGTDSESASQSGHAGTMKISPESPQAQRTSSIASQSMRSLSMLKRASKHITSGGSSATVGSDKASIASSTDPTGQAATTQDGHPDTDADDEQEGDSDSSEDILVAQSPPHEDNFDLHGNATAAQMELTTQMLSALSISTEIKDAISTAQRMLDEYVTMAKEREDWWQRMTEREKEKQTAWEQSLAVVVKEGETLENELRMRSRKRGSRFFDISGSGSGTVKQRPSAAAKSSSPFIAEESVPTTPATTFELSRPSPLAEMRANTQDTITRTTPRSPGQDGESAYSTDEEDEFFDAIENDNIPNLIVPESLVSPQPLTSTDSSSSPQIQGANTSEQYEGYKNLRHELNLTRDRPPTSLWSVLKHSIGMDLTKISFPVFFNEPTSMLQRMAEDMEFAECLDVAAQETDRLKRIAYVAAFAMSNYSSTIGRIAKPFNPMLSETFEYVHLDREYRYVSEQVSHHPPISACWAESPRWHYYGEVDAQNKFMGKSFEIRPTGVAHADLLLPPEFVDGYDDVKYPKDDEGRAVEHYSWKKVTTHVSGFILGSPTIDHYGEMKVVNHRTGDHCILTFKPRGWRGKDAYEISGQVIDSQGDVAYEIAGRWNSQLVARAASSSTGQTLNPDHSLSASSKSPEYILLWRNSEKPEGSPFNLTPFAISLNDCPKDTLKPVLCPTDCRLRPDQRAFELGRYEDANDLKLKQEEKQRTTRKARELGSLPPHKPRWFEAQTDGDTGERLWVPMRVDKGQVEYWVEREKAWSQAKERKRPDWKGVDDIFIEEPDYIRIST